jgi:tRNA-2-methylthio-N6-dimethylallyladenosine synthase
VCGFLHLPAQSGSNRILKAMKRRYTAEGYLEIIEKGREIVPDLSLTSDFIVGFPGEEEEDFLQTMELCRRARCKNSHIFKYSPRPGTFADKNLADNVPMQVKRERNQRLLKLQEEISLSLNRNMIGRQVKVLVEGLSRHPYRRSSESMLQFTGRTEGDHIVVFEQPAEEDPSGKIVPLMIYDATALTLFGKPPIDVSLREGGNA